MISLFKGLVPGIVLTLVVCGVIGSNGSTGEYLNIQHAMIQHVRFYWSWKLFLAATGLSWALFAMMPQ